MPFEVRTITAFTTSPFLTAPPGLAVLTEHTITSPMFAVFLKEPPSTLGVNLHKKAKKARKANEVSKIIEIEAPIDVSNVMVVLRLYHKNSPIFELTTLLLFAEDCAAPI